MDDLQEASIPKNRTEILKWNGWGYKDTQFELGMTRCQDEVNLHISRNLKTYLPFITPL